MKKKISLVIAMAMLMSAFVAFASVASAATAPRILISATEVDFTDPAYSSYADDFDWSDYNDLAVGEYKSYDVAVALTGIELATESYKSGKTTKYRGTSLSSAAVSFSIDAGDAAYEDDYVYDIISRLIPGNAVKTETSVGVGDTNVSAVYPAVKTAETVASTDVLPDIFHVLITLDTGKPITFTAENADIIIGSFPENTSDSAFSSFEEYATEKGNFPVTGVSLTLPLANATTYTIAFKDYDGSDIQSNVYDENDPVSAPADPTRETYTFSHWSETQDGPAAAVLTTATADKTYYAVYSPVAVTRVSLDKANISLKGAGATATLVATVIPSDANNKNVTWSSSNTSVATVANGVVTAVAPGKAAITVTTEDGGKTATCNVVVNPAPVSGNKFKEIDKNAELRNLAGDDVRADNNYGVAKIDHTLDTANYDYKIVATDDKEETKEWTFAQGGLNVEFGGEVAVNFIAIVKSATHKIVDIALQAYTK